MKKVREGPAEPRFVIVSMNHLDCCGEFALFEALVDAGLPVPRPVAFPDGRRAAGIASWERVDGEETRRNACCVMNKDSPSTLLPEQHGALVRIHALGPGDLPPVPGTSAGPQSDVVCRMTALGVERPVFEVALQWSRSAAAASAGAPHGHGSSWWDRRGHGLLHGEYAHIGGPVEGPSQALAVRADVTAEVGGFGRGRLVSCLRTGAGGAPVEPRRRARFWSAAISSRARSASPADGARSGTATLGWRRRIGRRVAENEYDILELMGRPTMANSPTERDPAHRKLLGSSCTQQLLMLAPFEVRIAANLLAIAFSAEAPPQTVRRPRTGGWRGSSAATVPWTSSAGAGPADPGRRSRAEVLRSHPVGDGAGPAGHRQPEVPRARGGDHDAGKSATNFEFSDKGEAACGREAPRFSWTST